MRFFIISLLSTAVLFNGVGCKRIQSKLDRLAEAAGIREKAGEEAIGTAEPAVTPEQEALEHRLQDKAMFEAAEAEAPKAEPF